MSWREWTILVLAVTGTLVLGWDVIVAFFNKVPNEIDTISGITQGWFKAGVWVIPFGLGVVTAHLVMPGVILQFVAWWGITFIVASALGLWGLGLWVGPRLPQSRARVALRGFALILLGLAEGWLFWPQ